MKSLKSEDSYRAVLRGEDIYDSSLRGMLGRYEYSDVERGGKSHKYWEIRYVPETGLYEAKWGRIGAGSDRSGKRYMITYTGKDALHKIQEKVAKGYRLVASIVHDDKEGRIEAEKKPEPKKEEDDDPNFNFMKELKKL